MNQSIRSNSNPAGIYLLKVNNRNTRTRCEICSKLTIKTPERRRRRFTPCSSVSIVNFEHVIACWEEARKRVSISPSSSNYTKHTAQKLKFPIKDFSSKNDQIRSFLQIWSHLLEESLMKNLIFCQVITSSANLESQM